MKEIEWIEQTHFLFKNENEKSKHVNCSEKNAFYRTEKKINVCVWNGIQLNKNCVSDANL